MALSKNSRNYPHVKEILDEAVSRGGVRYTLDNDGEAVNWRMLAYHVRKLVQQENTAQAGLPKGVFAPTPYDSMFIKLEGATVVIQFRQKKGLLTTLDRKPITEQTKKYEAPVEDEFVEVAQNVKKDLGI